MKLSVLLAIMIAKYFTVGILPGGGGAGGSVLGGVAGTGGGGGGSVLSISPIASSRAWVTASLCLLFSWRCFWEINQIG